MNTEIDRLKIEHADDVERRLDQFLAHRDPSRSRTQIQRWIKEGQVTVNDKVQKPNYRLQFDDIVIVDVPSPQEPDLTPEPVDFGIVYEDNDVIVVNKPRGLVVHPAPGHQRQTLVHGLLYHCNDLSGINDVLRPGIVHRIDKDTSGLLMVAKNNEAHLALAEQLKEHTVEREYIALVHGRMRHSTGTVDAPIGRNPKDRQEMAVVPRNGKKAVTHFEVLKRYTDYTQVKLRLETGRTHQIRVHMKYIGHPLAGDPKYGPRKTLQINGQALHAATLGFDHPRTGQRLYFETPLPKILEKTIHKIEK